MNKYITYGLISLFILCCSHATSQDTLKQVFRPRIGLGTGVMTYYGEVQNYQKKFTPTVNRISGLVYINAPISKMFNLEFTATYAKIAANERTLKRNYNFESRIRMGTAMLYYNFYPLFDPHRSSFHPFIGTGISSFEFLSKTDIYDANGNTYYYWSDGSIMNLAENDPLAPTNAIALRRDYTYETDLRELDIDNLGKYREQSLSIPLSLGVEWHMSPRWDFRVAATYNFTFTDLIDNVSSAGTGIRKGDLKKDRLLLSYVSLSYDLHLKKDEEGKTPLLDEEGNVLYVYWDPSDFDKDGVLDVFDKCPFTPFEALVDSIGCPLDSDKDGVPDYKDDEVATEYGNFVNENGVTISEEEFSKHLRLYYDSTGYEHDFEEFRTEVILNREGNKTYPKLSKEKSGLTYILIVGKETKDITVNDLHKYLGYQDYSSTLKGDTIYYTIGEFNTIEEAVAAKNGLEDKGIDVPSIGRSSGSGETIFSVDEKVIAKVERINIEFGTEGPDYTNQEQIYRIQVGAYRTKINTEEVFPGIDVVYGASDKDNINRYYSGTFTSYEQANEFQKDLITKGYSNTFIVAYEQQSRVTLVEAGVDKDQLPTDYSESQEIETFVEERDTTSQFNPKDLVVVDKIKLKYRVQLAYVKGDIPKEMVDILYNIKRIKPVKGKDGSTTYYSREYETKEKRDAAVKEFEKYGLEDVQVVIEYKGKFYTDKEFKKEFK